MRLIIQEFEMLKQTRRRLLANEVGEIDARGADRVRALVMTFKAIPAKAMAVPIRMPLARVKHEAGVMKSRVETSRDQGLLGGLDSEPTWRPAMDKGSKRKKAEKEREEKKKMAKEGEKKVKKKKKTTKEKKVKKKKKTKKEKTVKKEKKAKKKKKAKKEKEEEKEEEGGEGEETEKEEEKKNKMTRKCVHSRAYYKERRRLLRLGKTDVALTVFLRNYTSCRTSYIYTSYMHILYKRLIYPSHIYNFLGTHIV